MPLRAHPAAPCLRALLPSPLDRGAGAVEPRDGLGDLGLADDQRRHQPRDIVAGADGQQLLGAQRVDQLAVRHLRT